MKELSKSSNAVFRLNYHLVIVTKYRRKVFVDDTIVSRLKSFIENMSETYGVHVINQECGDDHIHLLIDTKPSTDLCKFINILKGHSSRMLRKEFSEQLGDKLWGDAFWSPSYFLSTVGNTSVDTIYNYIEKQRQ
ncbi:MAG: IS200/IS605 family transposase [Bacteroidales bacterium]|nr:IS200/IS605 family transposase [Bacteroidales bacterium]